jgi:ABC-type Fe3+ transport system substrate-binding protein
MVGIGIASRPPHPYAARLYVDFVLSKEGQKLLSDFGRYLARSEFAQKQIAKPKAIHVIPVNPALGEKMDEYAKQLREIFSR